MRTKPRRWIGVDGEGIGRKQHKYVLLACSDGDYIERRRGLSTVECLNFLLDLGKRDGRLCGYVLSYDWTMMLRDLSNKKLFALFRPERRALPSGAFGYVKHKSYELHWLAGAMRIRDKRGRKVTVWDLGKFYQQPFVEALEKWNVRPDVRDEIAAMKKRRKSFTWKEIASIRRYCLHECEALAELALLNERAHIAADLKPRGWYEPGSTASVLLNRHDIREKKGSIPPVMVDPVARAFFGGRAEISRSGYVEGPIFGNDISSAYPYHASMLPCLVHGRWQRVTDERALTARGVVHALVRGHIRGTRGVWAPLPVRLPNNNIVFPSAGASGWWWREEWLAARAGWKGLEFQQAFVLRRECDCKPFSFLPAIFERRLLVGKESGEGKILKLGPNSVYGKLAQRIGKPQFASRVWAGMITSGTRAQVLRFMLRHKRLDSVLMIATDGLFSTEELSVDKRIVLGGWERKEYPSITLIRPGMYWLADQEVRARGLGRENLDAEAKAAIMYAFDHGLGIHEKIELKRRVRFGGAKIGVSKDGKRSKVYGQWHTIPTRLSLAPHPKRAPDWMPHTLCGVDSAPYGTKKTIETGLQFELREEFRELED